jgi:DNA-binding transcriptional LysR family regulator
MSIRRLLLIDTDSSFQQLLNNQLGRYGFEVDVLGNSDDLLSHVRDVSPELIFIAVETDNSGFTIACVNAGMGLGIVAGRSDGVLTRNLATHSLRKQLGRRQIVIMWRKGRRLPRPLSQFVDEIQVANSDR